MCLTPDTLNSNLAERAYRPPPIIRRRTLHIKPEIAAAARNPEPKLHMRQSKQFLLEKSLQAQLQTPSPTNLPSRSLNAGNLGNPSGLHADQLGGTGSDCTDL